MKRGFTLVELSIVLVIIGLLIGGILVARSMVGTTKIQAQVKQLQKFDIAVTNFYTNYKQIPGDSAIFFPPGGGGYTPYTRDGYVDSGPIGGGPPVPAQYLWYEPFWLFIELSNSGMISTYYYNSNASNNFMWGPGNPFPAAEIGRGGIAMTSSLDYNLWYTFWSTSNTTGDPTLSNLMPNGSGNGTFSTAEALALDVKLDDGNPATGNIIAVQATFNAVGNTFPMDLDTSTTCLTGGKYNTSLSAPNLCNLSVKSNFSK